MLTFGSWEKFHFLSDTIFFTSGLTAVRLIRKQSSKDWFDSLVHFYWVHFWECSFTSVCGAKHGEHTHGQCLQGAIRLGTSHPKGAQVFSTTESSPHVTSSLDVNQFTLNSCLVQRHQLPHISREFSTWADSEWVTHKSNDIPGNGKVIKSGTKNFLSAVW